MTKGKKETIRQFRGLGKWSLPQPSDIKSKGIWLTLPKTNRRVPFGYTQSECGRFIEPIPEDLDALHEAFGYMNRYSATDVQKWLYAKTGKRLSVQSLIERYKSKRKKTNRARLYRRWARNAEDALKAAEEIETKKADGERVFVPTIEKPSRFVEQPNGEYICTDCGHKCRGKL